MTTTPAASALLLMFLVIYATATPPIFVEADDDGYLFNCDLAHGSLCAVAQLRGNASIVVDGVWLTPDLDTQRSDQMSHHTGWWFYTTPMTGLRNVTSFHTSFQFKLTTPLDSELGAGDGMAFFISPLRAIPNGKEGKAFGITNGTLNASDPTRHLFAVEFDTYQNLDLLDPDNNHVGIDINGVISNVHISNYTYPDLHLNLYTNSSFMVWVDYYAANTTIEVRMVNRDYVVRIDAQPITRPIHPILTLDYDLSTVFLDSDMFVGLSASTGNSYQGCLVSSWNFSLNTSRASISSAPLVYSGANTSSSANYPSNASFSSNANNSRKSAALCILLTVFLCAALIAVGVMAAMLAYWKGWCCSPGRAGDGQTMMELSLIPHDALVPAAMPRYTYDELSKATQGFHDKARVGHGAFSTVYKGRLARPTAGGGSIVCEVAVKRLNREGLRKSSEFFSEIKVIHALRHPRLVELMGWCYEKGEAMLVYQFMPNGSLADHLFRRGTALSSEKRVEILKGVADGLNHVHRAGAVHRDVKAANVLLTSDFEAMLGDFGLLRLLKDNNHKTQTMTAAFTPGYAAPELLLTRAPTSKMDVYSFGVLALEVACGRHVIDPNASAPEEQMLIDWVWWKQGSGELLSVLDPMMEVGEMEEGAGGGDECNREHSRWGSILHMALHCCHPLPEERPGMEEVIDILHNGTVMALELSKPALPEAYVLHHPGLSAINSSSDYTSSSTTTVTTRSASSYSSGR